jgi:hypothetical protein
MKKPLLLGLVAGAWFVAFFVRLQALPSQSVSPSPPLVDFDQQVRPIIKANCLECHSQDKRKGGLSLATYEDMLDGGRSGPVIRPGKGGDSLLVHRIGAEIEPQMPLDELPLSDPEIALLRLWINQGARPAPHAPPAPPPWEAPLGLDTPTVPDVVWSAWERPLDRLVARYLSARGGAEPVLVPDAVFARRAYLDAWGLLPTPDELDAFVNDRTPDKRDRLVATLLADDQRYAEHWVSFWNDLLRNEDGVTYFSENNGRRSITDWLLASLRSNLPYDQFVTKLLNPSAPGDPEGFLIGVNWRGETSAAVMPWMQASQNTAQVFLGINLKCNACHDSFVNRWKLKDAYALAAYFSPDPKLQLFRCDVARDEFAEPGFLYPELSRTPASASLADRRAAVAGIFTDPRNGRMPRTIVNRVWERLLGRGIVQISDEMDGKPWSPELLDWIASDFVQQRYDLKRLVATIMSSRAYQMPAAARAGEVPVRDYAFAGPEVRRLTSEQFADALGSITGEWSIYTPPNRPSATSKDKSVSDPVSAGVYGREWRAASTKLTRALGRPIRDQVTSVRATQATTLQALELVNGELLTRWLNRGARRLIGGLPVEPQSLFNGAVAGRYATGRPFDVDISKSSSLYLLVRDTGSNAPERVEPAWVGAELVKADGTTVPLSSLKPRDASGLRPTAKADRSRVAVKNPSRLVYAIGGQGFVRFRGTLDVDNPRAEIGSTLNPSLRFFVFDAEPASDRLVPPLPAPPLPPLPTVRTSAAVVDRIFRHALGRAPSDEERRAAEAAIAGRQPGKPAPDGVADLLWAVVMKPEFQLIY